MKQETKDSLLRLGYAAGNVAAVPVACACCYPFVMLLFATMMSVQNNDLAGTVKNGALCIILATSISVIAGEAQDAENHRREEAKQNNTTPVRWYQAMTPRHLLKPQPGAAA